MSVQIKRREDCVLTPKQRECFACEAVCSESVEKPEALLSKNGISVFRSGSTPAWAILDLGPSAPGGYPVFSVKNHTDGAILRIAYSDRRGHVLDERFRRQGDFPYGSCKYLGVKLPALPANSARFERYTLSREGIYTFPLVQGQQRFVYLELETLESFAEIEFFRIDYTGDQREYEGSFCCSDEKLTKLWYISAYTAQLATVTASQWEKTAGLLAVRTLAKSKRGGIHRDFRKLKDCVYRCKFAVSRNEFERSAFGMLCRAPDSSNGIAVRFYADGEVISERIEGGVPAETLAKCRAPIIDNCFYEAEVRIAGAQFDVSLNGKHLVCFEDRNFPEGSFGFYQEPEQYALVEKVEIEYGDNRYEDRFEDLTRYDIHIGKPFVSDGAKRDRLPWSADLEGAGKNIYCSLGPDNTLEQTLTLLFSKQNPEGYVFGTCYPEDRSRPKIGEYGLYQSDIFSTWAVQNTYQYWMYCRNRRALRRFYPKVKRNLGYLLSHVEGGIFVQRYDTSKGLWDHELGDMGKICYNNLLLWDALVKGAKLAIDVGDTSAAETWTLRSAEMKAAIRKMFWNREKQYFIMSENRSDYCNQSNPLALMTGFVSENEAKSIAGHLAKHEFPHGKVLVLGLLGLYRYGFGGEAFRMLTGKNPITNDWGFTGSINWYDICDGEDYPHTATECMYYPPKVMENGVNWGDLCHPDTGVAHVLSGCILGVQPIEAGFREFSIRPQLGPLRFAEGEVPTPWGRICVRVEPDRLFVCVPKGTVCYVEWQGKTLMLAYGEHTIEKGE